jgi:hypothetical protein
MSDSYSGYGRDVMSGDFMQSSNMLQKVKSNVSFRISSAKDMLMGINDANSMSPVERRMELRKRRLSLVGIGDDGSDSRDSSPSTPSSSSSIGTPQSDMRDRNVTSSMSDESSNMSGKSSNMSGGSSTGSPLMSNVDKGTKSRAQNKGFGY